MKITQDIVSPFYVFLIVMGGLGVVILPIARAVIGFSDDINQRLFDGCWLIGAVLGFGYTVITLRSFLGKSLLEKLLYWVLIVIFIGLISFPFLK